MSSRASYIAAYAFLAQFLIACGTETESDNAPDSMVNELVVHIDDRGALYIVVEDTGDRLDDEASRRHVEARLDEDPSTKVVVQTDPATPTEALVRVLDWLSRIGASSPNAPPIVEL